GRVLRQLLSRAGRRPRRVDRADRARAGGPRRRGTAQRAARATGGSGAHRAAGQGRADGARHRAQVDGEGPVAGHQAGAVTDAERLAALFAQARRAVVFTGAGVSTESGIPDFRSKDGVWARFDPAEFTYRNFMS